MSFVNNSLIYINSQNFGKEIILIGLTTKEINKSLKCNGGKMFCVFNMGLMGKN
jgi:hypothetical protein